MSRINIPLLFSTTIKHYIDGPPQPSWNLKYHLTTALIRSSFGGKNLTIEQMQSGSVIGSASVPADIMINETNIDNKYRHEAQVHLEKILKPYEHVLDTEWKDLKDDGITSEWVQVPNDEWEKRKTRKTILYLHGGAYYLCSIKAPHARCITRNLAKNANARVFGTKNLK